MVETQFKNTDIGLIPEDWELTELRNLLTFGSGKDYKHLGNGNIPVYGTGGIMTYVNDFLYEGDSVGIGRKGTIDKPIFLKNKFWTVDTLFFTHSFQNTIPKYIYFQFCKIRWKEYNEASGVPSLNKKTLELIKIPIPPLPEQKAIAEVLSDTDAWIESLEKLIAKKRLVKQGSMQQLLTPKEDWEVKILGEMSQIYTGNKNNQDKSEDGIYPFFVRSQKIEKINTYTFDGEAILIPGEGNLGSIFHYINGKFDFHQRVYKVSNFNGINGKYLFWYFRVYFGKHALQNTVKATVDSIRLPTIQEFEVFFPEINEQNRIATILSDMDTEIEHLEKKLNKAKHLKQGIMQQLLTGKIRLTEVKQEETKPVKKHNDHFNDAVLIGALASCYASEQYPMTRFKYTKVSYLLKRYKEEQTTGYFKKAAGPYKPETRYGGAEKIAIKNKYVATKKSAYKGKQYEGFINSTNIQEAIEYFKKWYGEDALQWVSRFKFETNDNLELWATVDMAIQDLKNENKPINLGTIKEVINNNKEWKDKLKRTVFSDDNIKNAIMRLETLYT